MTQLGDSNLLQIIIGQQQQLLAGDAGLAEAVCIARHTAVKPYNITQTTTYFTSGLEKIMIFFKIEKSRFFLI